MSKNTAFLKFESLIDSQPQFNDALKLLKKGREIQIILENCEPSALFYKNGKPQVEMRPALNPDIEFHIQEVAIDQIAAGKTPTMAALGILVVRQVTQRRVKIRVISGVFAIINGGYLKIIQTAGPEFMGFLGQYGLRSLAGIRKLIHSMK